MDKKHAGYILVVDDYPNWRELLTTILSDEGYSVDIASSMLDALQLIQNNVYDVVVIDIRLVDDQKYNVGGLVLLRKLKELIPDSSAVVITGYHDPIHRDRALNDYGADAYFLKVAEDNDPKEVFTINGFREIIHGLIQGRAT